MTIHCFTSFTFSYLDRASVLASSVRRHHPDWILWAFLVDREPTGVDLSGGLAVFDRVVQVESLLGDRTERWIFGHDIVETCTGIKGQALERVLAEPDAEMAFYLDPDIAVFGSLQPLVDSLREPAVSILLTPHQLEPDDRDQAIIDNEIGSLRHGVFNLGFLGVAADDTGRGFARWWARRLDRWCHDDPAAGLFTDQRWCDLVPVFFPGTRIVRDPGCNVASWNLSRRRVEITPSDGRIVVNGTDLRFFHFTKLGPIGDMMTRRYGGTGTAVYELWAWYRRQVLAGRDPRIPDGWWHYGSFDDGRRIPTAVRRLYRARRDLQTTHPSPRTIGPGSLLSHLEADSELRRSLDGA
jgi:hypothetical protein